VQSGNTHAETAREVHEIELPMIGVSAREVNTLLRFIQTRT